MSDMKRGSVYTYAPPVAKDKKYILLTTGKVATLGPWGDGVGVVAWAELPKRDKALEEAMGIL